MTATTAAAVPDVRRTPVVADVRLRGQRLAVDVAGLLRSVRVSYPTGSVAELTLELVDPRGRVAEAGLLEAGTPVAWASDATWEVGSVDWELAAGRVLWSVHGKSRLARRLRRTVKASASRQVAPSAWVAAAVAAAGGRAVCQPSTTRASITQSAGDDPQTTLDVVGALASDLDWSWCEHGGTLIFGSRKWAWEGGAGTPTWPLTWLSDPATDLLSARGTTSADDAADLASASVTVPWPLGVRMRPWDRAVVAGGGPAAGTWLVDSVEATVDGRSPVAVELRVPAAPHPRPLTATSATTTTGDDGLPALDGTVGSRRRRAVEYACAQVGKPYSYAAHPPRSWDCSKLTAWAWRQAGVRLTAYSFAQRAECARISRSQLRPGDLVFALRHGTHHVAMYIGGGRLVEAGSPRTGVHYSRLGNGWWTAHVSGYGSPPGADDD